MTASTEGAICYDIPQSLSIVKALAVRAERHPDRVLFRFLGERGEEEDLVTYGELWNRVCVIAGYFDTLGKPGDRIALFYNAGLDFIAAFFGCLLARRIAVPLNLPTKRRVDRCIRILDDCGCHYAATTDALLPSLAATLDEGCSGRITYVETSFARRMTRKKSWIEPLPASDNRIAFLQYTSGSTSDPKGVMMTHQNITANLRMMQKALKLDHTTPSVFWQPHHHDMGLMGGQLLSVFAGYETILMAPNTFIRSPLVWLNAISKYRAFLAGGPNFAYDLCVQRLAPERLQDCDLRTWRVAFNGAEVVRPATLQRFITAFAPYGFAPESMTPCYGLAEATLFVSGGPVEQPYRQRVIDAAALENGGSVKPGTGRGTRLVAGCGRPSDEIEVAIVDPSAYVERGFDEAGEIWVAGAANAAGYWGRPEATRSAFAAGISGKPGKLYLRTGDLGFIGRDDGQIYICGRLKDLLIIDGRNVHPEDVEYTAVECHPLIKPSSVAVFTDKRSDGQRVVAVIEADRELVRKLPEIEKTIRQTVRQAVSAEHGLTLADIMFVGPASMRKTTSGKIQRGLMAQLYASGELIPLSRAVTAAE